MPRFVALFRGINVGKAKRIAMADLRALLTSMGYDNVQTLLNSGNVVFNSSGTDSHQHAARIQTAVAESLGVDSLVVVRSARDMAHVVADNPLAGQALDPSRLLVVLTKDENTLAALATLGLTDWGDEQLHTAQHAAYVWCAEGILKSKVAVALMKGLADNGTMRNWATIEKIHRMLQSPDAL
ncbi:MAG: DUF1697 domain-containing protein [Rhodoferax sp.]